MIKVLEFSCFRIKSRKPQSCKKLDNLIPCSLKMASLKPELVKFLPVVAMCFLNNPTLR